MQNTQSSIGTKAELEELRRCDNCRQFRRCLPFWYGTLWLCVSGPNCFRHRKRIVKVLRHP